MGYSDDFASSAAPFSGDGDIFESPDLVRSSPITSERVVDTQSGFLVVLKTVESRLALSVKRRLGTPPVSSILLTPDESLQLSRILADHQHDPSGGLGFTSRISADVDGWLSSINRHETTERSTSELNQKSDKANYDSEVETDDDVTSPRTSRRNFAQLAVSKNQLVIGIAAAVAIVGLAVFGISSFTNKKPAPEVKPVPVEQMENGRVDKFSREFVSEMLDFNPKTYRFSQVHAMASMAPELMEKYWKETHFPLSPAQLKNSPQNLTLMITNVNQKRIDEKTREVDFFAELVSANSKLSSPVHLALTVGRNDEGLLQVLDQKDLSTHK